MLYTKFFQNFQSTGSREEDFLPYMGVVAMLHMIFDYNWSSGSNLFEILDRETDD